MQRLPFILTVAILSLITVSDQRVKADELGNDFQKLQGGWTLYYAELDGMALSPTANIGLVIQGNRYVVAPGTPGANFGGFALQQMSWPRQVNYVPLTGPNAGQVCLGIYSVIGATQVVCFAQPGYPRPTDFSTYPGSGRMLNIWFRQQ